MQAGEHPSRTMPDHDSLIYLFARTLAGRGHDPHGRLPVASRRRKWLRRFGLLAAAYLLLPLAIFDFTEYAWPFDEEHFEGRLVAIGPRPRFLVPGAVRSWDIPGGPDYSQDAWPFRVWKPVCVVYCRARGYELPDSWR